MSGLKELNRSNFEDKKLFGSKLLLSLPIAPSRSSIMDTRKDLAPMKENPDGDTMQNETKEECLFPAKFRSEAYRKLMPAMPSPLASFHVQQDPNERPSDSSQVKEVSSRLLMRIKKGIEKKFKPEVTEVYEIPEEEPLSPSDMEDVSILSSDSDSLEKLNIIYHDIPDELLKYGEELSKDVIVKKIRPIPDEPYSKESPTPWRPPVEIPLRPKIIKLPPVTLQKPKPFDGPQKISAELIQDRIVRHKSLKEDLRKTQKFLKGKMKLNRIKKNIQDKLGRALRINDTDLFISLQKDLQEIEEAYRDMLEKQREQEEEEKEEEVEEETIEEEAEAEAEIEIEEESTIEEETIPIREFSSLFDYKREKSVAFFSQSLGSTSSIASRKCPSKMIHKSMSSGKSLAEKLRSTLSIQKLILDYEKQARSSGAHPDIDPSLTLQYLKEMYHVDVESEYFPYLIPPEKYLKYPFDYSLGQSALGEFQFDVKYKYPFFVDEMEVEDFASPNMRAESYLRSRRIRKFIEFLGAHLVANQPVNPIQFLINLLDRCMSYRAGFSTPPLLFEVKHIESLYKSMDPMGIGEISLEQYNTGLSTLGVLPDKVSSENNGENETLNVIKEIFITDAFKKLKEQLDLMISIPALPKNNYFSFSSSSVKEVVPG